MYTENTENETRLKRKQVEFYILHKNNKPRSCSSKSVWSSTTLNRYFYSHIHSWIFKSLKKLFHFKSAFTVPFRCWWQESRFNYLPAEENTCYSTLCFTVKLFALACVLNWFRWKGNRCVCIKMWRVEKWWYTQARLIIVFSRWFTFRSNKVEIMFGTRKTPRNIKTTNKMTPEGSHC